MLAFKEKERSSARRRKPKNQLFRNKETMFITTQVLCRKLRLIKGIEVTKRKRYMKVVIKITLSTTSPQRVVLLKMKYRTWPMRMLRQRMQKN